MESFKPMIIQKGLDKLSGSGEKKKVRNVEKWFMERRGHWQG